ncbi:unnamed protein product [Adineta steineri]|uniref:MOSC domain-containing protein n=2 Tax=Adineta steineri TaxID=433720 RepID=A0A815QIR4_9BILA|nr:unnamed protein product [Adineta steineri]CAF1633948.1 unnamed protein product [Adineta steineri]
MHVKELIIYPIKSCSGIKVQEALVTKYGLALPSNPRIFDRRWMIVKNGRHLAQRVLPRMALIQISLIDDNLCVRAPNMSDLHIPINSLPEEVMQCFCWDQPILGLRYDDNVSHWFRTFLEIDDKIDLVVFDDKNFQGRLVKDCEAPNVARDEDTIIYHDMSPIHLCSLESVADLNTRLKKHIQVQNFRPNIVVENVDKPYAEDCWREIEIGEIKFTWIAACIRCLLPTIDPQTGIKDPDLEPWKTLRSYRLKPDTYRDKALFGIDLAPTDTIKNVSGIIRVGDSIRIIKDEPDFWDKT